MWTLSGGSRAGWGGAALSCDKGRHLSTGDIGVVTKWQVGEGQSPPVSSPQAWRVPGLSLPGLALAPILHPRPGLWMMAGALRVEALGAAAALHPSPPAPDPGDRGELLR